MKNIDFTKAGGMPLTQDLMDFMQSMTMEMHEAIVAAIGNNVIVSGCTVGGESVSDGIMIYQNKIMPFVGGNAHANDSDLNWTFVVVSNNQQLIYYNGSSQTVKYSTFAQADPNGKAGSINPSMEGFVRLNSITGLNTALVNYIAQMNNYVPQSWTAQNLTSSWGKLLNAGDYKFNITKKIGKTVHIEGVFRISPAPTVLSINVPIGLFPYRLKTNKSHIVLAARFMDNSGGATDSTATLTDVMEVSAQDYSGGISLVCAPFSITQLSYGLSDVYVNCDFDIQ
jgi:hypothetical protein